MANQIIPDHWVKSLILLVYFFGRMILLFCRARLFLLTCKPFNLLDPAVALFVNAILTPD